VTRPLDADHSQILLLPLDISQWVPSDHPARFIWDLVESLDLEALGIEQSEAITGRPPYASALMLRLWLYGWMDRTRSTRALEKRCMTDLAYIWLTGNLQPDHTSIWRFFRSNKKQLRKLFKQVVRLAVDAKLVGFALHALDGTKIRAASSNDTALHKQKLADKLKELDAIIEAAMQEIEQQEAQAGESFRMPKQLQDAKRRREAIAQGIARLEAEETQHLHPDEPEARMMKSRQGNWLGYNGQAMVDHESDLIVADGLTNEENDHEQLVPMIGEVLDNTGRTADESAADTGYFDGDQIAEAERRNYPVVVNLQRDSSGKGELLKEYFSYDVDRDIYICPLGRELKFERIDSSGRNYARRVYRCKHTDCPKRAECSNDKNGRTIKRNPFDDAIERQKLKQTQPLARNALGLRKEIVEHVFGSIKWNDGFLRFTVRGREGAEAQWSLICTVYNLRKLYALWRQGLFLAPAAA